MALRTSALEEGLDVTAAQSLHAQRTLAIRLSLTRQCVWIVDGARPDGQNGRQVLRPHHQLIVHIAKLELATLLQFEGSQIGHRTWAQCP